MFNVFTGVPALAKVGAECNKYLKNAREIDRLRAAGDLEGERELIRAKSGEWAVNLSDKLKITYEIEGEENIPESGPIVIVANHQSLADAIALFYLMRNHFQVGFISKDEWRKIAPLAHGIEYTRSIPLVRGDGRKALEAVQAAADLLKQGFSLIVFPEGTRSRGPEMNEFKPGAFKFAYKAHVPILPITLNGGYNLYEGTGNYHPCHIKIKIHPLVHTEQMDRHEFNIACAEIERTIEEGLE